MKNKINLAKIPVKKVATKWIEANFDGEKRKFEIRALNDGEKLNFLALLTDRDDPARVAKMYQYILACGLEITQEEANILYTNVNAEAVRVANEINVLSKMFEDAVDEEKAVAEKNSPKGA